MNILSTFLPGVREIRTPFTVGAAWVLVAVLTLRPSDEIVASTSYTRASDAWNALPPSVQIGIACFVIYLVGVTMDGITEAVWSRTLADRWRNKEFDSLISRYLQNRFSSIAQMLSFWVPADAVRPQLDLALFRLSHDAPEQYQQYDRKKAEARLRAMLAVPLTICGFVVALGLARPQRFLVIAITIAVGATLALLGSKLEREAELLVGAAFFNNYTSTPALDVFERAATDLLANDPDANAKCSGVMCGYLIEQGDMVTLENKRGFFYVPDISSFNGQSDEIRIKRYIRSGDRRYFTEDTLKMLHREGYIDEPDGTEPERGTLASELPHPFPEGD